MTAAFNHPRRHSQAERSDSVPAALPAALREFQKETGLNLLSLVPLPVPAPQPSFAGFVAFNPEAMAVILARYNEGNRPLSKTHTQILAGSMRANWLLTGEPILFTLDPVRVLNGQHRAAACVASGVPFVSMCVFGIDPSVFAALDHTRKRSLRDTLGVAGYHNSGRLAPMLKALWDFHHTGKMGSASSFASMYTPDMVVMEQIERLPGLLDTFHFMTHDGNGPIVRKCIGPAMACAYAFERVDADLSREFFRRLSTSTLPSPDEAPQWGGPVAFAGRFNRMIAEGTRVQEVDYAIHLIRAWNNLYLKRPVKRSGAIKEGAVFPLVAGLPYRQGADKSAFPLPILTDADRLADDDDVDTADYDDADA